MPTSLVIAIYHDKDTGNVKYLFVETGTYWSEKNKAPLRLTTNIGQLRKEDVRISLLEQLPTVVNNKYAQMQSPISVRSPSEEHETWKSRVYVPGEIWGFVKGGCNEGETPVACAEREFTEETKVPIENIASRLKLVFNTPDLNVYQLDLNEVEKYQISVSIDNRIRSRIGEVFSYRWSTLGDIPDDIEFNGQSQSVLDRLNRTPLVPGIPPPAVRRFPSLETESPPPASAPPATKPGKYIPPHLRAPRTAPAAPPAPPASGIYKPPHRRGGKTRRRKNGKRRRQTKKHI